MAASLPTFAVFYSESAGKYLSYMSDEGGELDRIVAAKAKNVWNARAKFEVTKSRLHPPMVHIRCSFHNKYLRRRSEAESWIVAAADAPEDDLSQWSSTLFQPEYFDKPSGTVRLLHIESGRYVQYWYDSTDSSNPYSMCVQAQSTDPADPTSSFRVVHWDDLVTLPKHVSFFHRTGIKYLGIRKHDDDALQFTTYDGKDKSFENEVVSLPDGSVSIRNVSRDAFWNVISDTSGTSSSYVFANYHTKTEVPPVTPEILFRPIKVDNDQLALLHLGTNKFCSRESSAEIEDGLRAANDDMSDDSTKLMPSAALESARIEEIELDLNAAWLHLQSEMVLNPGVAVENETGKARIKKVELPYSDMTTSEWTDTTFTFRVGPFPEIVPDQVPYIADSSEIKTRTTAQSYEWRNLKSDLMPKVVVHEVTVPPMTTVTAKLMGSFAACEVPFSYTRYDVPASGDQEEIYFMEDGRYTGRNYYNVRVEVTPPQPILAVAK